MQIVDCSGCGNCMDLIEEKKCPRNAISMNKYHGYANCVIDSKKCNNCGLCKKNIDCLNDCFTDDEKE